MEKLSSFKTSLFLLAITLVSITIKSVQAETLCEIKAKKDLDMHYEQARENPVYLTGAVVSQYRAESCDLRKYGGPFGNKDLVEHVKNDDLYSQKVAEELAQKQARDSLVTIQNQMKTLLKSVNADGDWTNAEMKQILRGILKYLKAKEMEE
jgi:hypothetical protein